MSTNIEKISRKYAAFQTEINKLVGEQYHSYAPPPTMRTRLSRDGDVEQVCEEIIQKAHAADEKVTVKKYGAIIDENGHRVEEFAFEIGRVEIEKSLYTALVVDDLLNSVHLLLIRSDITTPRHTLFPDLGTPQDWKALQKCADRFSPKSACQRHAIDVWGARYIAAKTAAANHFGTLWHLPTARPGGSTEHDPLQIPHD